MRLAHILPRRWQTGKSFIRYRETRYYGLGWSCRLDVFSWSLTWFIDDPDLRRTWI